MNGVLQTTPVVVEGPPLVITGINVPAGAGITPITAEEVITTVEAPLLTITKSISPVTDAVIVTPGVSTLVITGRI